MTAQTKCQLIGISRTSGETKSINFLVHSLIIGLKDLGGLRDFFSKSI